MECILETKKKDIQNKGLDKLQSYFDLETEEIEGMDSDSLKHLYNMARLGMQFEKEMNLSKRAVETNYIRVGKLIAENREEMKKFLKRTLPQYS